jgi:hypothetical protein
VLCAWVALNGQDRGAQLAAHLEALAEQVNAWREGPLAGRAFQRPGGSSAAHTQRPQSSSMNPA